MPPSAAPSFTQGSYLLGEEEDEEEDEEEKEEEEEEEEGEGEIEGGGGLGRAYSRTHWGARWEQRGATQRTQYTEETRETV